MICDIKKDITQMKISRIRYTLHMIKRENVLFKIVGQIWFFKGRM